MQRSPGLRVELEPAALSGLVESAADGALCEVGIKQGADRTMSNNRGLSQRVGRQAFYGTNDSLLSVCRRFPSPHAGVGVFEELVGDVLELRQRQIAS